MISDYMTAIKCPKCGYYSGDSWSQCNGRCPMSMSPVYDPTWKLSDKVVQDDPNWTDPQGSQEIPY